MSQKYQKLKTLLQELFQLDQPDLDFGLYRVMHAKSAEVSQFLDKDLLPQVQAAFGQYKTADKAEIEKELSKAIDQAQGLGVDPAQSPKVADLRARLANEAVDIGALESEVYDHLFSFFRRYYSEGDFLAKRVYKPGVYAIPYEGEEVTLHWANKDQYYIKTSEYLRDYAFRLRPDDNKQPLRVHYRLADAAEGEHGNVKAAEGKDRVFILAAPGESGRDFIAEEDGEQGKELVIRFEYRPATLTDWPDDVRAGKSKPPAQKDLSALAAKRVLAVTDASLAAWTLELGKPHVTTSGEKADTTRLEAHLKRYTARNTFDYFIHKDLGTFLRRELDFYIKNEVMHLDDVESETAPRVEQYLSKIKVIRKIAGKIIAFLAQLEDFQKKLWLKKKFVVETQWCIRVGCIPETFYAEIAANEAQHEEWIKLFVIDEIKGDLVAPGYSKKLKPEFLKAHPTLVVDTRHFDADFTARLLEAMGDVDEQTDGTLFHSENFQSLSLMSTRYCEQVECVYIDPPYNTDASPIAYKNGYQRSSWIALLADRLNADSRLRVKRAVRCIAIDDVEYPDLVELLGSLSPEVHHATASVRSKPQGRPTATGFSANHEYAVFWGDVGATIGRLPRVGSKADRYPHSDEQGIYAWANFRKSGTDSDRADRRRSFYPVYVRGDVVRIPEMSWNAADDAWTILETPETGEAVVLPVDSDGNEKVWTCSPGRARDEIADVRIERSEGGRVEILKKYRPNQEGALPGTWWDDPSYSASESGTKVLKDIFGARDFDYPKSVHLVRDCLRAAGLLANGTVLDYFAGSGTTGHAVINLNRADGGCRKFILVEMGDYFDTVLLPRIKKVTFTPEWKDGKPKRLATPEEAERSPRIVKVVRLESYEDALNNLETRRTVPQQLLLGAAEAQGADGLREQYILRYMLDVETRGSQSLLNVQAFTDPTAYKLKVKRPGSDESREVNVDLLETFNWLIGLTVKHIAAPQTFSAAFERDSEKRLRLSSKSGGRLKQDAAGPYWFRTVTGTTPDGRRTLIIWRKLSGEPEQDNLVLDEWFTKQGYSAKDSEFDLIYVNGGNNLENLKTPDDLWKVRLIEEEFHRLMFETEGV
jgi:adenine-specific DNA-methyltransferase